jgi:hypothetical protein
MGPNLTKKSLQFEKLVARILKLIGERDDIVIHDHNISDPETGSSRQVDVLVERNGIRAPLFLTVFATTERFDYPETRLKTVS